MRNGMMSMVLVLGLACGTAHAWGGKGDMSGKPVKQRKAMAEAGEEGTDGPRPEVIGAFSPTRANLGDMRNHGLRPTGLEPVYPADADCPVINSPFAAQNRGDGSRRSPNFYQGYHSGADIPVPEGTPILAIADGTLIHKQDGPNIGGIGIILQHSPEDTGLPVWTYTEYKHLQVIPEMAVGTRVNKGEEIARAGVSGTTGGYYGPGGHSHLHLAAFFAPGDGYKARMMFVPENGQWMDPLALFRGQPLDSNVLRELPDEEKRVTLPYRHSDGRFVPEGSKMVWPFACTPRPEGNN